MPDKGWVSVDGSASVGCSDAGTYVLVGLTPGSKQLTAQFENEAPFQTTVEIEAPTTRVDIVLDQVWLLTVNVVTFDGTPLLEAVQKVTAEPWGDGLSAVAFEAPMTPLPSSDHGSITAGFGTFRAANDRRSRKALPKQAVGVMTLPPDRPVHVALLLGSVALARMPAYPDQNQITFTLAPEMVLAMTATVTVRAVDHKGAPVVGARIALDDAKADGGGQPTDADGRVVLRYVRSGRLSLSADDPNLAAPPLVVDVKAGAKLDLGDIVLRERVKVDLVIRPVTDDIELWSVWLEPLPGPAFGRRQVQQHVEGGRPTLRLHPGRNALFASCDSGCAIVELDTAALPPQPMRLKLQPGAPLRVENRVGPGFTRASVRTPGGVQVFSAEASGSWERTVRVPVGTYEVVCAGMNGTSTKQLTVGPEGATLVVE